MARWLRLAVKEHVLQGLDALCIDSVDPSAAFLKAIALLLSGHMLPEATALCAAHRDPRLSALLSVAGGHHCMRNALTLEISSLKRQGALSGYEPERLGIYELLMGKPDWIEEALDLDWHQSLGIYLW